MKAWPHKFDTDPDEVPFLQAHRDQATIVRPATLPRAVFRDRDKVLAAAIAGKAGLIVTGDEDLLVLGQHCGIRILSPRQFVALLDRLG